MVFQEKYLLQIYRQENGSKIKFLVSYISYIKVAIKQQSHCNVQTLYDILLVVPRVLLNIMGLCILEQEDPISKMHEELFLIAKTYLFEIDQYLSQTIILSDCQLPFGFLSGVQMFFLVFSKVLVGSQGRRLEQKSHQFLEFQQWRQ